jgi:hypothetical protein
MTMTAKDLAERQREFRERRKETHTRMGELWIKNELVPMLDDLTGYYGIGRLAMLEKLIEDRHAAWSEGEDTPEPAVKTFKDKRLGHHRTRPCPTCTGREHVQAFADTNGICPTCGNARCIPEE